MGSLKSRNNDGGTVSETRPNRFFFAVYTRILAFTFVALSASGTVNTVQLEFEASMVFPQSVRVRLVCDEDKD